MAHAVHWLAPAAEMKPFTQLRHTDMPTMLWYVPAAHALHTDEPGVDWNEPTAQRLHTVAPVASENVPAMHALQELWPVWPWKAPGEQRVQLDCPDREKLPAPHVLQDAACELLLNRPAGHDSQPLGLRLRVPGWQGSQPDFPAFTVVP